MIKCENKNSILYENLDKLLESGVLDNKKIVLFGMNTSSYVTKKYLEQKGYRINAYIDNNDKKVMETKQFLSDVLPRHLSQVMYDSVKTGIVEAYKPEELLCDYMEDVIILIASKYYPSMCHQLQEMGYQEQIHIFQTLDFYGLDEVAQQNDLSQEELSMEEVRKIQLQIVSYLKDVCQRNHLRCYMTGGTLLGAVRHKGYIPWDDDIDMTIPMPDYKKLVDILLEEDRYDVSTVYNNPEECSNFYMRIIDRQTIMKLWEYPFLTTMGVSIDVFPLVGLPERMDETMVFFNRIRHLNTMYMKSFLEEVNGEEGLEQERRKLREQVLEMMERYSYDDCTNAGYILSKYWEKDIMPKDIYRDTIEMEFEDIKLAAPVGYHDYLERIFGDYMQLPPEQDQYVTHNYRVYRK